MAERTISSPRPAVRVRGAAAASTANVSLVTITVARLDGRPAVYDLDLSLSDAASGAGLTVVTATGTVAQGASGIILDTRTAKKDFRVQTDATGKFILSITDTAKTGFVICVGFEGEIIPIVTLVTANYG